MARQDALNQVLLEAVRRADYVGVRDAVEAGADAACVTAAVIPPQDETEVYLDIMRYLFSVGTDVNDANFEEGTLLMFSAYRAQLKYLQLYVDAGVDINLAHAVNGVTGLQVAVQHNLPDVVRFFIEAGADVNQACYADAPTSDPGRVDGETALHFAAAGASREIVELLLAAGGDKAATTARGETPLDYALVPARASPIQSKAPPGASRSEDVLSLLRY